MKKICAALLVLSLTTGAYITIDSSFSPVSAATTQKVSSVKVTKKVQPIKLPGVDGKVEYPQISGMKNTKLQANLNKKFVDYANQANKAAIELNKMAIEYPASGDGKYNVTSTYILKRNKGGILSLVYNNYAYTGGAHGNYFYEGININLNTGKTYTLKELFKPGVNYVSIISKEIKNQLAIQNKYWDFRKEDFKAIPANQEFYLTDKGIVVYFSTYEYTSFATGIPEFEIPYSKIKKYLTPGL